jgi:hypothetical protein
MVKDSAILLGDVVRRDLPPLKKLVADVLRGN